MVHNREPGIVKKMPMNRLKNLPLHLLGNYDSCVTRLVTHSVLCSMPSIKGGRHNLFDK